MPDVNKIIKGVECCIKYPNEYGDCLGGDCPYGPRIECHNELMQDVLALLKAQEPVEPKKVNRYIDFDGEGHPYTPETYDCGACGKELPWKANYCPECGKKVRWK